MRDRHLPMKWVEDFVAAGNGEEALISEFTKRNIKPSTRTDQVKRLQKCGLLPCTAAPASLSREIHKPFVPVPKSKSKKSA